MGFTLADLEEEIVEILPDNVQAFHLFRSLGTQWRVGPVGMTGLDYNVLFKKMDRMNLAPERYDELEEEVGIMEMAVLGMKQQSKKP